MERPVTRVELQVALARILRARGLSEATSAVEVLITPVYETRLFVVVAADDARTILNEALLPITGSPHPTVADVWILGERQVLAILESLYTPSTLPVSLV
jgi:hypothetical protein